MNPKWAEENLQTIRTLMERSALYRRALAPIMIFVGAVGTAGGMAGFLLEVNLRLGFITFWSGIAALALVGVFLLVRRQALKDSEPVWSPPARRVVQALMPPFFIAAVVTLLAAYGNGFWSKQLIIIWCLMFGCAICSAGFFLPRSMKYFGWIFLLIGACLIFGFFADLNFAHALFKSSHLLMAAVFGGLHLAYGIYLYFTEKKNPVA